MMADYLVLNVGCILAKLSYVSEEISFAVGQ